jgi:prepilin peptidase CpaA
MMNSMPPHALAALLVAFVAMLCDVRTRRIPNVLTLAAAAAALVFGFVSDGAAGLGMSAAGWLVGAALFFPFFALGGMGAGDVKLLAALGAWLGPADAVWLAIFASIAGGVLAAIVSLYYGYLRQAGANVWLMLMQWRTVGPGPVAGMTLRDTRGPRLAYAIPIAAGLVCTLWRG